MPAPGSVPTPRFSLRWKITLPFILLALLLSLGMVYLLSRIAGQEQQNRYLRQLTDSGQQAADADKRCQCGLGTAPILKHGVAVFGMHGSLPSVEQLAHSPQRGRKAMTTRCPISRSVTFAPSSATRPAASWPSSIGIGRRRLPSTTERSE